SCHLTCHRGHNGTLITCHRRVTPCNSTRAGHEKLLEHKRAKLTCRAISWSLAHSLFVGRFEIGRPSFRGDVCLLNPRIRNPHSPIIDTPPLFVRVHRSVSEDFPKKSTEFDYLIYA